MKLLRFAKKRGYEGNASYSRSSRGKENEDSHEDTGRLLQDMSGINTEASHSDN